MKKFIALLLCFAMLLALAACSGSEKTAEPAEESTSVAETPAAEAETTTAPAADAAEAEETEEPAVDDSAEPETPAVGEVALPLSEEKLTYTMFMTMPFFVGSLIDNMGTDLKLFNTVQELTNIYFDITAINGEVFDEKFQLMVASGTYCDVMDGMSKYTPGYDAAINEGICIDLYDLANEYAPNYMAAISADTNTLAQLITDEGQMATFGILYAEANCETQGYLIRNDWLSAVGMDIPTTYDQLHDVLVAFKDTYGAVGMPFNDISESRLDYGYQCAGGNFMVIDGTVVSGFTTDSYYDFLSMCADWYSEGLIYPDFYSASTGDYDQLMVSNEIGIVQGAATSFSTITAYLNEEEAANFSLAGMTPVTINADDELHYCWNQPNYLKRTDAWAISADCEDPIPLVQFVNYMYSDAGELLFNYGTEGETFTYDENGKPQYTDVVINNPDQPYFFASYLYASNAATEYLPALMDVSASYYSFEDAQWNAYYLFSEPANDGAYNYPGGTSLTSEENERYSQLYSDMETYIEETIVSWVIGQTQLNEASWSEFQAQLKSMGIEEIVQLKQAAYDRYQAKLNSLLA